MLKRKDGRTRCDGKLLEIYVARLLHDQLKRGVELNKRYRVVVANGRGNGRAVYLPQVDVEYREGFPFPRKVLAECKHYRNGHGVHADDVARFAVKRFFIDAARYEMWATTYYDLGARLAAELLGIETKDGEQLKIEDDKRRLFGTSQSVASQLKGVKAGDYKKNTCAYTQGKTERVRMTMADAVRIKERLEELTEKLNRHLQKYGVEDRVNLLDYAPQLKSLG